MKKSSRAKKNGVQTDGLAVHRWAEKAYQKRNKLSRKQKAKSVLKVWEESLQETKQNSHTIHVKTNESREEVQQKTRTY